MLLIIVVYIEFFHNTFFKVFDKMCACSTSVKITKAQRSVVNDKWFPLLGTVTNFRNKAVETRVIWPPCWASNIWLYIMHTYELRFFHNVCTSFRTLSNLRRYCYVIIFFRYSISKFLQLHGSLHSHLELNKCCRIYLLKSSLVAN